MSWLQVPVAIVMGVDVDEAGVTSLPLASISSLPLARDLADLGDAAVLDRDISLEQVAAAPSAILPPRITRSAERLNSAF